jgi:hypothetical protein
LEVFEPARNMARSAAGKRSVFIKSDFLQRYEKTTWLADNDRTGNFGGRIPGMIEIALRVNVFGQVLRLMLDTIAPKSHSTFIAM